MESGQASQCKYSALVDCAVPKCAKGRLFRGWVRMQDACGECGYDFKREPGYYLGAIYFNYGLTALIVTFVYVGLTIGSDFPKEQKLAISFAPALLFPLWFFRYARSLWLGFDYFVDEETRR